MKSPCVQNQVVYGCGEEQDEREVIASVHHPLHLKVIFSLVVDFSLFQGLHRVEGWVEVVGIMGDDWIYQTLSG
jgi:hypothetical protein